MRSLIESLGRSLTARPAFASAAPGRALLRGERVIAGPFGLRIPTDGAFAGGAGLWLAAALVAAVAGYGVVRGGHYEDFVRREGGLGDYAARLAGLGITSVDVSGRREMSELQVLAAARVIATSSSPFFDVDAARERLKALPIVKQASVRKIYPDRLQIDVVERDPAALWQKEGQVRLVASDGVPLDDMKDLRHADLPFVVGEGANSRLGEYSGILAAMGELRSRVAAGRLIDERRWTLKLKSGLEIQLPETDPVRAVNSLVQLEKQAHVLEKDVVTLDFRAPGRVYARLSEDAAEARRTAVRPGAKGPL